MADKANEPVKAPAATLVKSAAPVAGAVSSGGGISDAERELRNTNAALSQENAELRAEVQRRGGIVRESYERSFPMSEGVRNDLVAAAAAVEKGDLRSEEVAVMDPATGEIFGHDDAVKAADAGPRSPKA
jgi:hypothetical protein